MNTRSKQRNAVPLGVRLRSYRSLLLASQRLSTADAGAATELTAARLRQLVRRHPELGEEPYSVRVGGRRLWRLPALLEWLEARAQHLPPLEVHA